MKIVAVQDFDAGSKAVQLTPDFKLQLIGSAYFNHREALSAVLGDSSVAKIVEYDTLKSAAENHDYKIISEAENIKYPYVIFENSNSEIRRMPFRDALKELEEKNNVAIEKQSYDDNLHILLVDGFNGHVGGVGFYPAYCVAVHAACVRHYSA